jgi:hypothetical protein
LHSAPNRTLVRDRRSIERPALSVTNEWTDKENSRAGYLSTERARTDVPFVSFRKSPGAPPSSLAARALLNFTRSENETRECVTRRHRIPSSNVRREHTRRCKRFLARLFVGSPGGGDV